MTSNEAPSAVAPQSRRRSFPNVMASLLFSHRAWSSVDTDHYVPTLPSSQALTTDDDDQLTNSSSAVSGTNFGLGSFNWIDPDTNFCAAPSQPSSSASSSSMRRSETWTASLQRPLDLTQSASRPTNYSSSNLRALQRSLSEVFGPNKIIIELPEEARHPRPEVSHVTRSSSSFAQPLRMSVPSSSSSSVNSGVSRATPSPPSLTAEPGQTQPRPMLKRQSSLASVPEADPVRREVLPVHQSSIVDTGLTTKARFSMPGAAATTTCLDENQNTVGHANYADATKMAAGEMTSYDHVIQVPDASAFTRPSRKFGIMDLLGAGERKRVRNRDVNLMTPQSW